MHPQKQIAVFGSFLTNAESGEFAMAEELGYLLAQKGFQVICGGHGGIANPLVAGVMRGGGRVLGLSLAETKYPGRIARMNPLITERVHIDSIPERLEYFAGSDGFIFFSGGIGTLSEFSFMWHSLQLEADFDRPLVLLSEGWKRVLARIRNEQMIKYKYYRLVHLCDRAKDAVAVVSNDYSVKYDDPEHLFYKEAVLFDLDGTLVESPEEEFVKSCENIGYFFHMSDAIEAFRKAGGFPDAAENERLFYVNVLENLGIKTRSATEIADYARKGSRQIPHLYHDVADILRYFKENGFSTGVVSARHPVQVKEILSAHDLSGWVDLVCPRNHPAGRADRPGLGDVLESFGFKKDRIVYVGDNFQEDYLAPRSMEIDSILLDRHLTQIANDAAVKIRSLRELKHIVRPGSRSEAGMDLPGKS